MNFMKIVSSFLNLPIAWRSACFLVVFIGLHWVTTRIIPESKRLPERDPIAWAQYFFLRSQKPETLILGSSIADRLDPFNKDPRTTMITINGGSSFDGLAILGALDNPDDLPKVVAIEINRLVVLHPKEWLSNLLEENYRHAWENFPILREANRPVALMGWPIHVTLNKAAITLNARNGLITASEPVAETAEETAVSAADQSKLLELNIQDKTMELDAELDPKWIQEIVATLDAHITSLEQHNVRVILFHMPIHPELQKLKGPQTILHAIKNAFPESRVPWVPEVSPSDSQYTDAVHLDAESAKAYYEFLISSIDSILLRPGT